MAFEKKTSETTTLAVHRCRFVDYAPSAITALAFAPLPLPSVKGKKKATQKNKAIRFGTLAVGHANGNTDLCEWMGSEQETRCAQGWVVKQTIAGPYPSKVDSLAFVIRHPDTLEEDQVPKISDLRLFSSGGGSELIEWDIATSRIRQMINSQGGAIWSISPNPSSTMLALGCEDGTVRILSLENDTLTHVRRLGKVKSRMLSIAWGPPIPKTRTKAKPSATDNTKKVSQADSEDSEEEDDDDDDDGWTDSWLVTGCSDSSVRKWDLKTGQVLERMGTDKIRGERTLVWSVGVLGDGTIVSGDSMGMVKFWDSRTSTQLQSFQAHNADVLCLAISPEGTAVYTSGVDQKTVQFSLIKVASSTGSSLTQDVRWAPTASKRMHSHDVRAIAIWPPYAPIPPSFLKQQQKRRSYFPTDVAPILASGGLDMNLVLAPAALPSSSIVKVINPLDTSTVATFEDAYHRRVAYPLEGRAQVSKTSRLVSCIREAGITVWRIAENPASGSQSSQSEDRMDEDSSAKEPLDDPYKEAEVPYAGGWEKVLEMDLKVSSNLVVHRISDDGLWLAVSDTYETKLFRLHADDEGQITLKRVREFSSILEPHIPPLPQTSHDGSKTQYRGTGSIALLFTPDSSKLILSTTAPSYVLVVDLTGDKPQVLRRFDHHLQTDSIVQDRAIAGGKLKNQKGNPKKVQVNGIKGAEEDVEMKSVSDKEDVADSDSDVAPSRSRNSIVATAAVTHLAISPDGQWLASSSRCLPSASTFFSVTSSSSHHTSTKTHIYNLDSIAYHTTLPSFPLPVHHLTFAPGTDTSSSTGARLSPSTLLLTFPNNSIQVYDVEQRTFPAWGKDLSTLVQKSRLGSTHDAVLGASFASSPSDRFILFWSASWICKVSLDALAALDFRKANSLEFTKPSAGKKRRRGRDGAPTASGGGPATPAPHKSTGDSTSLTPATTGGVTATPAGALGENDDHELRDRFNMAVKMNTTYRPILCVEFLGPAELVVVERPLVDVLSTLPPAYFKHRYGKS